MAKAPKADPKQKAKAKAKAASPAKPCSEDLEAASEPPPAALVPLPPQAPEEAQAALVALDPEVPETQLAKVSQDLEGCRQPAGEPAPVLPSCLGFLCRVPSCLINLRRCSSLILVRSLRGADTAPTVVPSPPAAAQTQNHTGDYDMPSDVLDGEPLQGEPLEDPEEELPEHDEVLCVEAAEKGLAPLQEEGVGVPAEPAKKKWKEMGREEILRDDRLRAKLEQVPAD